MSDEIKVETKPLADAANWVAGILPAKSGDPSHSAVHLKAADEGLTLTGFDGQTQAVITVPCLPGKLDILVHAKAFSNYASRLDGRATLTLDYNTLLMRVAKRREFKLGVMPADTYPRLHPVPPISGEADGLSAAVERVKVAAGTDDSVIQLLAIWINADGRQATLLTADQYRIARLRIPYQGEPITVNPHASRIAQALKGWDGPVRIGRDKDRMVLQFGNRTWVTTLIDKGYPDAPVTAALDGPVENGKPAAPVERFYGAPSLTVSREGLLRAVGDAAVTIDSSVQLIDLFVSDGAVAVCAAGSTDAARHEEEAEVEGDFDAVLRTQANFLTDGLRSMPHDRVRIYDTPGIGRNSPWLLRGLGAEDVPDPTHDYAVNKMRRHED